MSPLITAIKAKFQALNYLELHDVIVDTLQKSAISYFEREIQGEVEYEAAYLLLVAQHTGKYGKDFFQPLRQYIFEEINQINACDTWKRIGGRDSRALVESLIPPQSPYARVQTWLAENGCLIYDQIQPQFQKMKITVKILSKDRTPVTFNDYTLVQSEHMVSLDFFNQERERLRGTANLLQLIHSRQSKIMIGEVSHTVPILTEST